MIQRLISTIVLFVVPTAALAQKNCENLKNLALPDATITSAVLVAAHPAPPTFGIPASSTSSVVVPENCAVRLIARPTSDSEIEIAVWLPAEGWNGKYQQLGNGGWAGSLPPGLESDPLIHGYAVAATDDGHKSAINTDASFAIGHPEKLNDFAFRAIHLTREFSRVIIETFYDKDPRRSYFVGCSDGGREALMQAQRFPEDFDGIVAGAPANDWVGMMADMVWNGQANFGTPGSAIPPAKLPAIQKAALDACDALDGVKDGLIENPPSCHYNPDVLACKPGTDTPDCLTPAQLETLRKIYAGPKDPRTGKQVFPGMAPGSEAVLGSWNPWITASNPQSTFQLKFGVSYFGQAVNEQQNWDFRTLNFAEDLDSAYRRNGWLLSSISPDLRSFRDHNGKLIQYHGWGDPAISPYNSIVYYESVQTFLTKYPDPRTDASKPVSDFYRLFMVPGMGHCGLGTGPNHFGQPLGATELNDPEHNIISALDSWVETGVAPDHIVGEGISPADRTKKLTRPLCPYPQIAHYKGTGDTDDAANFACVLPKEIQ